jgi:hypothetical protein
MSSEQRPDRGKQLFGEEPGAASSELDPAAGNLVALLNQMMAGVISRQEAVTLIEAKPELLRAVNSLAGRTLHAGAASISFGSGSQTGDISIGNVAGRDIIEIKVMLPAKITSPEQFYDVRGLPNPYLGMRPYSEQNHALFVGREREVAHAVDGLTEPGARRVLCTITGVSGSGKSSFALAGLVPGLTAAYGAQQKRLCVARFRPLSYPLDVLVAALPALGSPFRGLEAAHLANKPGYLASLIAEQTPHDQANVLVIDQFEELFLLSLLEQRVPMIRLLEEMVAANVARTHILITLRSDFYGELLQSEVLADALQKRGAGVIVVLRTPTEDTLKRIIQHPLTRSGHGKRFEAALLDQLAAEAITAGSLPLLQEALRAIWERGSLTSANHGALTDAIKNHAEIVFTYQAGQAGAPERTSEEKTALTALLLSLVQVFESGDQRRYIRQHRDYNALIEHQPSWRPLCEQLIAARLLQTSDEQGVVSVELTHEALLTHWPTLGQALKEQEQTLEWRSRFKRALADWREDRADVTRLLSGPRLHEAETFANQQDVELISDEARAFLRQSQEQRLAQQQRAAAERRRAEIVRLMGGVAGAGLGYSLGFTVLLGVSQLFDPNRMVFLSELPQYALLSALYMFSVGTLVGLALSLALWLTPGRVARDAVAGVLGTATKPTTWPRWVVTMLAGATFSALGITLFLFGPLQQQSPPVHPIVAGALMGALLGAAVAQEQRRRVGALTLAGSIGLWIFAVINNLFFDDGTKVSLLEAMMATGRGLNPFAGLLGGALLGALMGLGFYVVDAADRAPL